jgi:hypothetical protein
MDACSKIALFFFHSKFHYLYLFEQLFFSSTPEFSKHFFLSNDFAIIQNTILIRHKGKIENSFGKN